MFICHPCLEKRYTNFAVGVSYGKCEICGHSRACADIEYRYLNRKPEFSSQKDKTNKSEGDRSVGISDGNQK